MQKKEEISTLQIFDEIALLKLLLSRQHKLKDFEAFVAKYGSNSVSDDGRSILSFAIIHRNNHLIDILLRDSSCNINYQEPRNGFSALHFAVQGNNFDIVQSLTNKDIQIDIEDANGNTPLWRGMFDNVDERILIHLLNKGANPKKKNKHGVTPKSLLEKSMIKTIEWLKKNK